MASQKKLIVHNFRLICVNAGLFEQVYRGKIQERTSGLDRTE